MEYDIVITQVKDNNKFFKHLQNGERFIQVRYWPTEFVMTDYTIEEDGRITDQEWSCQHISTHQDELATNYMTFEGAKQYATKVQVCDDCDEIIERDGWDHE